MKKFLIVVNSEKDSGHKITCAITDYIKCKGGESLVVDSYAFSGDRTYPIDADCILVLGGDGTLLKVAGDTENMNIPLFGINLGTTGFLTEGEPRGLTQLLDKLFDDTYSVEKRMMLDGIVTKKNGTVFKKSALNDIVVTRSGFSRIIGLNVYVGGQMLDTYEADGVIISTPTGSTGYNLSAGGPIVSPKANLLVITPVSPHSLTSKSIILPESDHITVEIVKKRKTQETEAIVSFDGGSNVGLAAGDKIDIFRSEKNTKLVKVSNINFYEILRNKLGGN